MFYRIKFAEWNLNGDSKYDIKKQIQYFQENKIIPKIESITEETKEEYIERIMTEDDRIRSTKYRNLNMLIKE